MSFFLQIFKRSAEPHEILSNLFPDGAVCDLSRILNEQKNVSEHFASSSFQGRGVWRSNLSPLCATFRASPLSRQSWCTDLIKRNGCNSRILALEMSSETKSLAHLPSLTRSCTIMLQGQFAPFFRSTLPLFDIAGFWKTVQWTFVASSIAQNVCCEVRNFWLSILFLKNQSWFFFFSAHTCGRDNMRLHGGSLEAFSFSSHFRELHKF